MSFFTHSLIRGRTPCQPCSGLHSWRSTLPFCSAVMRFRRLVALADSLRTSALQHALAPTERLNCAARPRWSEIAGIRPLFAGALVADSQHPQQAFCRTHGTEDQLPEGEPARRALVRVGRMTRGSGCMFIRALISVLNSTRTPDVPVLHLVPSIVPRLAKRLASAAKPPFAHRNDHEPNCCRLHSRAPQ